ncbi:MAG: carbohydrate ABC transporter permease [Actinomycetota bacterium]
MQAKSTLAKAVIYAILAMGGLLFLFPLLWMLFTAVKPTSQSMEMPPRLLPYPETVKDADGRIYPAAFHQPPGQKKATLVGVVRRNGEDALVLMNAPGGVKQRKWVEGRYVNVPPVIRLDNFWKAITYKSEELGYIPFLEYAKNTLYIALLCVVGTVLSNSLIAYGFARVSWPGRNLAFALTIATMMVPFPVLMTPIYALFKALGWVGSPKPLWVPAFFGSAFSIFLLRQFLMSLPFELSDAARIDGCSEFGIFRDVIMPLAKPALAVVALFNFMHVWNDFLGPLIYLTDQKAYTLAYGLQAYESQHGGTQWPLLMAASSIVVLPVILLFFLAQKTFIQGVTVTGMKN